MFYYLASCAHSVVSIVVLSLSKELLLEIFWSYDCILRACLSTEYQNQKLYNKKSAQITFILHVNDLFHFPDEAWKMFQFSFTTFSSILTMRISLKSTQFQQHNMKGNIWSINCWKLQFEHFFRCYQFINEIKVILYHSISLRTQFTTWRMHKNKTTRKISSKQ